MTDTGKPDTPKKDAPAARIHPTDRARQEAGNAVARLYYGEPAARAPVSYYTPILIQCTLPHSDPKAPTWVKTNGSQSLILASGVDETGQFLGLPYGSFPRLVLAFLITRVMQTGDRRIDLSEHFGAFLREIGYTGNHKGSGVKGRRLRDQLIRLLRSSLTFQDKTEGHLAVQDVKIAPRFELWFDTKEPEAGSLFGSYVTLSEEFQEAILRAPVPLRADVLAALKKSPLALDVYMWVSYRLFTLQQSGQEQVTLTYGRLQSQFGTGIAEDNYRLFRSRFKQALAEVAAHWQDAGGEKAILHYEVGTEGLTLYRSPLLIGKAKAKGKAADTERILQARAFDVETKKQARLIAGNWSVDYLTEQYFNWIEAEGITPKDPKAHFLRFIEVHRERSGNG